VLGGGAHSRAIQLDGDGSQVRGNPIGEGPEGHAEIVAVVFDPARITSRDLLE